ncbi:RidA family protein [Cnuibacter physcomitrellae]|uniref:RidA family protein n=1 Tax=Cnuibacter physcomitrellae TaxID=1619308 RepID=UPI002175A310|nr:RidA family protein [Cnuibacter physcomitrellae]MCS5497821.1 RidA family protein [Cnuibacter physcomitrellae]
MSAVARPDETPTPAGSYRVARVVGDLVLTAGMTPRGADGALLATGRLGEAVSDAEGGRMAALATERALDAAISALPPGRILDEVVSLTVFVAATSDYTAHSRIADAASTTITERMPGSALPVRAAVGIASLPGGAPVEVQLTALHRQAPAGASAQ